MKTSTTPTNGTSDRTPEPATFAIRNLEIRTFTDGEQTPQSLAADMRHDLTYAVRHLLAIDGIGERNPCADTAALFARLLHLLAKCEDVSSLSIVRKDAVPS